MTVGGADGNTPILFVSGLSVTLSPRTADQSSAVAEVVRIMKVHFQSSTLLLTYTASYFYHLRTTQISTAMFIPSHT